jgi:hypothetical protein
MKRNEKKSQWYTQTSLSPASLLVNSPQCSKRKCRERSAAAQQTRPAPEIGRNQKKSEEIKRNERNEKKSQWVHTNLALARKLPCKLTLVL